MESLSPAGADWITPSTQLVSLIVFLVSADIKPTVWGGPIAWKNGIFLIMGALVLWLIASLRKRWKCRCPMKVDDALNDLFKEANLLTRNKSGNAGLMVLKKKDLDELYM
ncbi:MAG: hypothetical protein WAW39_20385 [Prosthecobacter sp.]|uniref:hypothetical protein n=1 Tax=Prosthecobacter sp. TaxID=1965333 RepID=UPI003BB1E248